MKAIYSKLERGTVRVYLTNVVSANEKNTFGKDMYFIQEIEGKGYWKEEISMEEAELLLGHKLTYKTSDGSVGVNSHMCFLKEEKISNPKNATSNKNTFKLAAFFLASLKLSEIEKIINASAFEESAKLISQLLQPKTKNYKDLINYFISDYHIVLIAVYELLHKRSVFDKNKYSTKGNEILMQQEVAIKYDKAI